VVMTKSMSTLSVGSTVSTAFEDSWETSASYLTYPKQNVDTMIKSCPTETGIRPEESSLPSKFISSSGNTYIR
jgi:hypothetical protein